MNDYHYITLMPAMENTYHLWMLYLPKTKGALYCLNTRSEKWILPPWCPDHYFSITNINVPRLFRRSAVT